MSKKAIFIGLATLLILCISTVIHADQHYDQYPGIGFLPENESKSYYRDKYYGFICHNDTSSADYTCPVTFNIPEGSTYFIKSIGMCYVDNLTDGWIKVELRRKNLYTGAGHLVANWLSGYSEASSEFQTARKGTNDGYKLVDTKKFAYWLHVEFYKDGVVNPWSDLILYQVRIHYGT